VYYIYITGVPNVRTNIYYAAVYMVNIVYKYLVFIHEMKKKSIWIR